MSELRETELRVFVDAVTNYFNVSTRAPATIRSAYLADTSVPQLEYTGLITFYGQFKGCIHVTASSAMIRALLVELSEQDMSEANVLDAIGEIANTIAGNARRHFGRQLEISVPLTIKGAGETIKAAVRARPFVIDLRWRQYDAKVIVDLAPSE